jgi:hypothetical protein
MHPPGGPTTRGAVLPTSTAVAENVGKQVLAELRGSLRELTKLLVDAQGGGARRKPTSWCPKQTMRPVPIDRAAHRSARITTFSRAVTCCGRGAFIISGHASRILFV